MRRTGSLALAFAVLAAAGCSKVTNALLSSNTQTVTVTVGKSIQLSASGNDLVVRVKENPLINRVNFEGNSEVKDTDLVKEVELRERMMFTRAKVQSDVNRVIALYRRTGYYNVKVAPKIIRLPENRVDLVFEISEGVETTVGSIRFIGNKSFGDGEPSSSERKKKM